MLLSGNKNKQKSGRLLRISQLWAFGTGLQAAVRIWKFNVNPKKGILTFAQKFNCLIVGGGD